MDSKLTYEYRLVNFNDLTVEERKQVWDIRNLPEIRKWMANPDFISWESHLQFLDSLRNRSDINHYLAYDSLNNIIGSVNFKFVEEGVVERGIYITPKFQGNGHANRLVHFFYDFLKTDFGIYKVVTKVLKNNIASNALETRLGALKSGEDADFIYYSLNI